MVEFGEWYDYEKLSAHLVVILSPIKIDMREAMKSKSEIE